MSRSSLRIPELAERLIAHEAAGSESFGTTTPAAFPVCEKLRPHLAVLMGHTGFRALLARSLSRAELEAPSLRALRVNRDGSLYIAHESEVKVGSENSIEDSVVLLSQLLRLLVAFIGENLTLSLLSEIWPKLPLNGLNFGTGAKK